MKKILLAALLALGCITPANANRINAPYQLPPGSAIVLCYPGRVTYDAHTACQPPKNASPEYEMATIITLPFPASSNQIIFASSYNSNFNTIYNDYNGFINHLNLASGSGIFAIDTKGDATATNNVFGGGGTIGFTFGPYGAGTVPLSVAGAAATAADLFDVTGNGAATGATFSVGFSGNTTQSGAEILNAPGGGLTTQVGLTNDNNAGVKGLRFNVPTGSVNGLSATIGGANPGTLAPEYTAGGLALGPASKHVWQRFIGYATGMCLAFSVCPNTIAVSLTTITYTSSVSYDCYSNSNAVTLGAIPSYAASAGNAGAINYFNATNATINLVAVTTTIACDGS